MVYYQVYLFQSNTSACHCVTSQIVQNSQTLGQFFEPLYLELFLPEWRNTILQCLGPNPLLQTIIDIDAGYRTQFFGVLWQKEMDKYYLEMELNMGVWEQLGRCEFGPEARIN
jgi:hypothetical protein